MTKEQYEQLKAQTNNRKDNERAGAYKLLALKAISQYNTEPSEEALEAVWEAVNTYNAQSRKERYTDDYLILDIKHSRSRVHWSERWCIR